MENQLEPLIDRKLTVRSCILIPVSSSVMIGVISFPFGRVQLV
jgi:hypothetical protein